MVVMRLGINSLFAKVADLLRGKNGSTAWPSSSPAGRSAVAPIAVIGLVTGDEDRRLLAGMCSRNSWRLLFANTNDEAQAGLDDLKPQVILCDRDLPGKGWRETVNSLASSPHRACIILLSEVVDTYLWEEVVRHGGYDVLSKPLREQDVVRAIRLWSYWQSATQSAKIPSER
jgi:FixJ family two-component response regulator